jgi:enamine deaminase RidA (YjgF/YER057c/UK114 family)
MATIEKYCAPASTTRQLQPGHQVTGAQTILFLAGQVPYAPDGTVNHIGDFMGQARQVFGAIKPWWSTAAAPSRTWSRSPPT